MCKTGSCLEKSSPSLVKALEIRFTPDMWEGFSLYIYDFDEFNSREDQNLISFSPQISFDSKKQLPIWSKRFTVTLVDPKITEPSSMILNIDVPTPLDEGCYIKVILPDDLLWTEHARKILTTKIFKSETLSSEIG